MTDPTCGNCHAELPRWWAHHYCDACLADVFADLCPVRALGRELDGAHPTPLAETGEERERRKRASNRQVASATTPKTPAKQGQNEHFGPRGA